MDLYTIWTIYEQDSVLTRLKLQCERWQFDDQDNRVLLREHKALFLTNLFFFHTI